MSDLLEQVLEFSRHYFGADSTGAKDSQNQAEAEASLNTAESRPSQSVAFGPSSSANVYETVMPNARHSAGFAWPASKPQPI
jgi:hypothetical protein